MAQLNSWLSSAGIQWHTLLVSVALILVGSVVIIVTTRLLRRFLIEVEEYFRFPYRTVLLLTRSVSGLLWVCLAILLLSLWGVGVTGLWTAIVSMLTLVGVGFIAVWTIISNITASFFIMIWRPFQSGETVEILPEGMKGRLIGRNLMFSVLHEDSGSFLHVPNNLFFQKVFRVTPRGEDRQSAAHAAFSDACEGRQPKSRQI